MASALTTCRYCGQELSYHTEPEPFTIQVPCHRCGYISVLGKSVIGFTLEDTYRHFLRGRKPLDFEPTRNPQTVGNYLQTIAGALLDVAIEQVQIDLPVARSSLVSVFSRREHLMQERISRVYYLDPSTEPRSFPKVATLLWGVLGHCGGLSPDVIRNFSSKGVSRFLACFTPVADEIVTLATRAMLVRRSELAPSFDGSRFAFSKTARHTAVVESELNKKQLQRDTARIMGLDEVFSKEALECQRLALGFNARDIADLALNGFEQLAARTEVAFDRNVYWVRLPKLDHELRRIIELSTLTLTRLREFYFPLFFDLGSRNKSLLNPRDAILNAAGSNWSYYYPFSSMSENDGEIDYVSTSRGLMTAFMMGIESQRNTITDRLIAASRRGGDQQRAKEISLVLDRGHRAVESAVCEIGSSAGWLAMQTPRNLPCGDIDALMAHPMSDSEVLIVACEVKDVDLPGHTEDAHERQAKTVGKALGQLDQKAAWVVANWSQRLAPSLFADLRKYHHGIVLKVLVTRNSYPFDLVNGAECIPVIGLSRFLAHLRTGLPPWYKGTRRASVVHF